ncbi:MAG: hypothetical protein LBC88_01240 [Spirochaetaceae bacterium]|jgi:uncharacterized integral membrane protein|nr:hypothetical protein [Spirochaetaceae bacterium]
MPWRLLGFIFFFGIVLVFSVFNRHNGCDISFGFVTLRNVPVYLTVFASFLFGLVCSLPYAVSAYLRARRGKKASSGGKNPPPEKKSKKERGSVRERGEVRERGTVRERGANSNFAEGKEADASIAADYGID